MFSIPSFPLGVLPRLACRSLSGSQIAIEALFGWLEEMESRKVERILL
jgi:hypothetical protein